MLTVAPTLLVFALLGGSIARSHESASASSPCTAPARPGEQVESERWQAFLDDVGNYRACIAQSMQQHQQQAQVHQQAARQAADAWNQFVRTSLNAPEDFPHKPRSEEAPVDKVLTGNWDGWEGGTPPPR